MGQRGGGWWTEKKCKEGNSSISPGYIDSTPPSMFTALLRTPANVQEEWRGMEGGGEGRETCNATSYPVNAERFTTTAALTPDCCPRVGVWDNHTRMFGEKVN